MVKIEYKNNAFKITGALVVDKQVILNLEEMKVIVDYYNAYCTAEYILENYILRYVDDEGNIIKTSDSIEDIALKLAYEAREVMNESEANDNPITEGDAIRDACKRMKIKMIGFVKKWTSYESWDDFDKDYPNRWSYPADELDELKDDFYYKITISGITRFVEIEDTNIGI